jgi:DNA polymerase III epsilon subunit family exonuclease
LPILAGQRVAVLDLETTGWRPSEGHTVLEVARVTLDNEQIDETWSSLVGPPRPISVEATRVHGITEAMLSEAPDRATVAQQIRDACAGLPLAFHNAAFDLPFLQALLDEAGLPPLYSAVIDTLGLSRGLFGAGSNTLGELAGRLGLPHEDLHRALGDARTAARVLVAIAPLWERERGVRSIDELAAASQDAIRETPRRAQAGAAAADLQPGFEFGE